MNSHYLSIVAVDAIQTLFIISYIIISIAHVRGEPAIDSDR